MIRPLPLCFSLSLLFSCTAIADEVVREVPDNAVGGGYGALTGLMVGAVGGPIGAVAGAGIGYFVGHEVQHASGLSGTAYEVKDAQGELKTVRSPNARFDVGQQVRLEGIRLIAQPE
jgi:outer membrane lipoprotein SlyB